MKAAFIGMGKLGFPCALAAATKHDVVGYDISPAAKEILATRIYPHIEESANELLEQTTLRIVDSVGEAVEHADIVFVAVQTPHHPDFEGLTRMPEGRRADFNYAALRQAVRAVATAAERLEKFVTVVVISTVLPGTCERDVLPLLRNNLPPQFTGFVYNPFFIAMGTTITDYLNPEFVLLGTNVSDHESIRRVSTFYQALHSDDKLRHMSVASAELTKVAYNVYIGMKIVVANHIMELAHHTGANCDDVASALMHATDRVVSNRYMRGGMGDGGGCHPRDQIALSWLSQDLGLSYDVPAALVEAREKQTEWLADLARAESMRDAMPIVILGKSYKKGTNLTIGSPAILLKNILDEWKIPGVPATVQWDPWVDPPQTFTQPSVFVIATDHDEFFCMDFPPASVVIDPWGKVFDEEGIKVIRVGRK